VKENRSLAPGVDCTACGGRSVAPEDRIAKGVQLGALVESRSLAPGVDCTACGGRSVAPEDRIAKGVQLDALVESRIAKVSQMIALAEDPMAKERCYSALAKRWVEQQS